MMTASEVANELHKYAYSVAVARHHRPIDPSFLKSRLEELSRPERLRRLRPRQLAALTRSLVRLGFYPGEDWLADLDSCCYCHPGPFDPVSATVLLQSLAALHAAAPAPAPPPAAALPPYRHQDECEATASTGSLSAPLVRHRHKSSAANLPRRGLNSGSHGQRSRVSGSFSSESQPSETLSSARGAWSGGPPSAAQASAPSSAATPDTSVVSQRAAGVAADAPEVARAASFRFPHAVYLRLVQGGVNKYSYEQLAKVLQAFRSLGVPVTEELSTQVGSRMARQLLEMDPERRQRALAAVRATTS